MKTEEEVLRLVEEVQNGNEESAKELIKSFEPLKKSVKRKFKHDLISDDDIEQQINLLLYEAFFNYDKNLDRLVLRHIKSYVYLRFLDWWRVQTKYYNYVPVRFEEFDQSFIEKVCSKEYLEYNTDIIFYDLLNSLESDLDKHIMIEYFINDKKHKEIAYELDMDRTTVTKKIRKSLQKIKKNLH